MGKKERKERDDGVGMGKKEWRGMDGGDGTVEGMGRRRKDGGERMEEKRWRGSSGEGMEGMGFHFPQHRGAQQYREVHFGSREAPWPGKVGEFPLKSVARQEKSVPSPMRALFRILIPSSL